jgi:hypothetical protein
LASFVYLPICNHNKSIIFYSDELYKNSFSSTLLFVSMYRCINVCIGVSLYVYIRHILLRPKLRPREPKYLHTTEGRNFQAQGSNARKRRYNSNMNPKFSQDFDDC